MERMGVFSRLRSSTILIYLWPQHHTDLIQQLVAREVQLRYRQSWLGVAWLWLTPLLTLAVYTLVFRRVFNLRWNMGGQESDLAFAVRLYAGLAVFQFFAECVNRAPRLVLDQPHLVKKVVFPLEILPWISVLAAGMHLGVAAVLLLGCAAWVSGGWPPTTALALPLVWLPLLPLCLGLGWALAAVGTFIRDVGQLLGLMVSLLLFMSPVFFGVEALPTSLQHWIFLNPLALIMTQTREVMLDGIWPNWSNWGFNLGACMVVAWMGARLFRAARRGFADAV